MSENGRDLVEIWGFQHRCKLVGVGERQKDSSLTNDPRRTRIHALERYNKGLYSHREITEIHEAVLEIWRGGCCTKSDLGMLVKMVMRRFLKVTR